MVNVVSGSSRLLRLVQGITPGSTTVGVIVDVSVSVGVAVGVRVGVAVAVCVGVLVGVFVGVLVGVLVGLRNTGGTKRVGCDVRLSVAVGVRRIGEGMPGMPEGSLWASGSSPRIWFW